MAKNVNYEKYWERACIAHYKLINLSENDINWKSAYLERYLQRYMESFTNYEDNEPDLEELIKTIRLNIYHLTIQELLCQIDLKKCLEKFTNLIQLNLTLGRKNAGMDYKRQMIGMKMLEAEQISEALKKLVNLKILNLSGNMIDDDLVKLIFSGVHENNSIETLNLSHNR